MTPSPVDESTNAHVSDGVLLAIHDREAAAEVGAGRAHVEQCAECRARLSEIARRAEMVRESLASVPIPSVGVDAFRRRIRATNGRHAVPLWRRPTFQAAAAIIVLAVAAAASPLRHWVGARITRPNAPAVMPPAAGQAVTPKTLSGATVSFAAAGPEFTLRLDSVPAVGTLIIVQSTTNEIVARVTSGAGTGGDEMVVLPGELRLRNSPSSRANYTLSLPPAVTRLRVVIGGRRVFDGPPRASVKLAP